MTAYAAWVRPACVHDAISRLRRARHIPPSRVTQFPGFRSIPAKWCWEKRLKWEFRMKEIGLIVATTTSGIFLGGTYPPIDELRGYKRGVLRQPTTAGA